MNPDDDLVDPDGNDQGAKLNMNDFSQVHKNFATKWRVNDKDDSRVGKRLFDKGSRKTDIYNDDSFEPEYRSEPLFLQWSNR